VEVVDLQVVELLWEKDQLVEIFEIVEIVEVVELFWEWEEDQLVEIVEIQLAEVLKALGEREKRQQQVLYWLLLWLWLW
jgi:hypothetical protein